MAILWLMMAPDCRPHPHCQAADQATPWSVAGFASSRPARVRFVMIRNRMRPGAWAGTGAAILLATTVSCRGLKDAVAGCTVDESTANAVLPFFDRPFAGPAPVGNDFDHDLPLAGAENGYLLTLCGVRDT